MEPKDKKVFYGIKNANFKFSVKDVDSSTRTVCCVLSTYNYLDFDNDVVLPGAASDSIKQRGVDSSAYDKIVHALFHDLTRLPGKFKVLDERNIDGMDCIYMESKLADTVDGNDTLKNYLAEIYNQHSIGYIATKYEWLSREAHGNSKKWETMTGNLINPADLEGKNYVRVISKLDLWEGSTVTFGANKLSPCLGMKSINKDAVMFEYFARIDRIEKALRTGTQSDEMMHNLSLQLLQLKQSLTEIFDEFKLKEEKPAEEIPIEEKSFDATEFAKLFITD